MVSPFPLISEVNAGVTPVVLSVTDRLGHSRTLGYDVRGNVIEEIDALQSSTLVDAGILGRRKDGNRVYYRIVDEGVFDLCEQVCGGLQMQLAELTSLIEGTR